MRINKFRLYYLFLAAMLIGFFGRDLYALIVYKRTHGIVRQFTYTEHTGYRGRQTEYYPIIDFTVGSNAYSFISNNLQKDALYRLQEVDVLYNPNNPEDAFICSFLGLFGKNFMFFVPVFVFVTALLLSNGTLPKYLFIGRKKA